MKRFSSNQWRYVLALFIFVSMLTILSGYSAGTKIWHLAVGGILLFIVFVFMLKLRQQQKDLEETLAREVDFVSLVSHQLRIPLTELSWMIDSVFETSSGMTQEQSATIQEIRGIVRGSIELVGDLLNVSRIQRGILQMHCEETLLAELVNETIKPLQRVADEHGVKFVITVPEKLTAWVDAQKAMEAIRNIIDNALRYGPRNSTIEIGAKQSDCFVTLSIGDHGPGIAKEIRSKLFDKASAFTKKGTTEGAGLGLYLTKQFIELMGGEVKFESSPKGTVFYVAFPTEKTALNDEQRMKK